MTLEDEIKELNLKNKALESDRDNLLRAMEYIEKTKRDDHHIYAGNTLYTRANKS
jgi:hypothetical protein